MIFFALILSIPALSNRGEGNFKCPHVLSTLLHILRLKAPDAFAGARPYDVGNAHFRKFIDVVPPLNSDFERVVIAAVEKTHNERPELNWTQFGTLRAWGKRKQDAFANIIYIKKVEIKGKDNDEDSE